MNLTRNPRQSTSPRPGIAELAGAAGLGAIVFVLFCGPQILNPHHWEWMLEGDRGQSFLGWRFFSQQPWGYPPSAIPRLRYPFGTSLLQTDSIPLWALFFKLAAPRAGIFQYWGIFFATSCVLQSVGGYCLVALFTPSRSARLLGAGLFVTAPVFLYRLGQSTASQWPCLAIISLVLWQTRQAPGSRRFPWLTLFWLNAFVAGVHPYLLVETMALTTGLFLDCHLRRPSLRLAIGYVLFCGLLLGACAVFGYLGFQETTASSIFFTWDSLAPFNSFGLASLVPRLRAGPTQYEGFCYLGLGGLFLFVFAVDTWARKGPRRALASTLGQYRWGPVLWPAGLLTLVAMGDALTLGGNPLVSWHWLTQALEPLPSTFRAMGRFVWPAAYLWLLVLVVTPLARLGPRRGTAALLLAMGLNFVDLGKWCLTPRFHEGSGRVTRSALWETTAKNARALYLVPPFLPGESFHCSPYPEFTYSDYFSFGLLAAEHGLSYNSARVARPPREETMNYCRRFLESVARGEADPKGLYVLHPGLPEKITREFRRHADCRPLDGFEACLARPQSVPVEPAPSHLKQ